MRGTGHRVRRGPAAWLLAGALAVAPTASLLVLPAPARADLTPVPTTLSTAAQNTSSYAVPVPAGVQVRAIDGILTEPEVVAGGTTTFRVNGAVRTQVPSALYQKVEIPVTQADVISDGTIGLTMTTEGPAAAGATCLPTGGVASLRKLQLDYRGTETAPTTVAAFFPPTSAGITVVIPEDADDDMITAGLTAVAALASRYDSDDTPVDLSLTPPTPETATAGQRVVALVAGPTGDVTTAVSTTSGIPMLTLTGGGDALVNAARALSADVLDLSGTNAQNPSAQAKPRSTATTRTLTDLGEDTLAISGYGSVTQQFELRQDSFGEPVAAMRLHLEGSHTAFADASGARLDVRANGTLIGSTVLGSEGTFKVDATIPAGKLQAVNQIDLTLTAVAPDGSACTPPSIPAAEVDVDTGSSSVSVTHGTGDAQGFQLFPQILDGVLPVALRSSETRQASAAINAASLIAVLQRAAGSPLEIQLVKPDVFLADKRSGLIVGANSTDSEALDAPLKLSSTRLFDRDDATVEVTSQDPYAALEAIDRNDRLVLMLGSWAPANKAAPGELARKVVDAVTATGWENLDGDLVIADASNPAFVAASRSLAPHQAAHQDKSYAKWFVLVIVVLLLLLALQVVVAIRRDRRLSDEDDDEADQEYDEEYDEQYDEQYYEGDDDEAGEPVGFYEPEDEPEDELGDVDDLDEPEYADETDDEDEDETAWQHDTGEIAPVLEAEHDEGAVEAPVDPVEGDTEEVDDEDDEDENWDDWEEWSDQEDALPVSDEETGEEAPDEAAVEEEPEPYAEPVPTPPRRRWSDQPDPETSTETPPEPPAEPAPEQPSPTRRRRRTRKRPSTDETDQPEG